MVLLTSWVMIPVTPGLTVKVVVLMVAGFIASLKVMVTSAREHTPLAALGGVTETTAGVRPTVFVSQYGLPHPVTRRSIRNAMNQAV
jgi:hypothetical protein